MAKMYIWCLQSSDKKTHVYFTAKEHAINSLKTSYAKKKNLTVKEFGRGNDWVVASNNLDIQVEWEDSEGWVSHTVFTLDRVVEGFVYDKAVHL